MNEEKAREIAIQILDEFEELLAAKGVKVPSENREGREEEACLYGREYYELGDAVVGVLVEETEGGQRGRSRPSDPDPRKPPSWRFFPCAAGCAGCLMMRPLFLVQPLRELSDELVRSIRR